VQRSECSGVVIKKWNTTDNLFLSFCIEQIDYYYNNNILDYSVNGYFRYPTKIYKYDLVSLWHDLGKRLILYCLKYLYTQYTEHFYNLKVTGFEYKKYNIKILDKNLVLDYFLSFTEFKDILIKELFDLDTGDIMEYGYDMYIFTIYNVYL